VKDALMGRKQDGRIGSRRRQQKRQGVVCDKCWWGKNIRMGVEEMGEVEGFIQSHDLEAKED
jgi:hypothetical protein